MIILYLILIFNFLVCSEVITKKQNIYHQFSKSQKMLYNNDIITFLIETGLLMEDDNFNKKELIDSITKIKHIKLSQKYNAIEVFGRNIKLHFNKNNEPSSFSSNFYRGFFNNSEPTISNEEAENIVKLDFDMENAIYKNIKLLYYIKEQAELMYHIDVVTYSKAFRYLVNAHNGEIVKRWTLIFDDGPITGSGENLLGEWVDEINLYEGMSFSPMGDLVTPYLVCEEYCFDYGDCGGSSNSGCEINPQQGACPENYIEDCNGECFHVWYLQFPGVGNGFCNDPWINVDDEQITGGNYNMVDESNLDLEQFLLLTHMEDFMRIYHM